MAGLNESKVTFITCVNDEREYGEALAYIDRLSVPEGYIVDAVAVRGASGMAAGYQEAMESSDAKYKVYLHQDVRILNTNFIPDILELFKRDAGVGMIGVMGCDQLPENAHAVGAWNVGLVYHNCIPARMERFQDRKKMPYTVEALDGLLLATQYDVPWRADLFDGWDFYDISQCMEMQRAGHRCVVPYQEEPWCYHDNTYSKMQNYYKYRGIFAEEYQDRRSFIRQEVSDRQTEFENLREQSREQMRALVDGGRREELEKLFCREENRGFLHLREYQIYADISGWQRTAGEDVFWKVGDDAHTLKEKLRELRMEIKRRQFGLPNRLDILRARYGEEIVKVVSTEYGGGV